MPDDGFRPLGRMTHYSIALLADESTEWRIAEVREADPGCTFGTKVVRDATGMWKPCPPEDEPKGIVVGVPGRDVDYQMARRVARYATLIDFEG